MNLARKKSLGILIVVLVLVLLVFPASSMASKTARALTLEELSTTWIGISEDELSLIRLVLREDGTGHGGYIYRGHRPSTFKILSWSYGRRFTARIEFDQEVENFSEMLFGDVIGTKMELQISGNGWKRNVALRMEEPLLDDWKKLASANGFLFSAAGPDAQSSSAN